MNKIKRIFSILIICFIIIQSNSICFADADPITLCKEYISEIETLISECEAKGYDVSYEKLDLAVLKKFRKHMAEDILSGKTSRVQYTFSCLNENYTNAKENLSAYLNGTKIPKSVPKYKTETVKAEGSTLYAKTVNNGTEELRPVFLNGYGHFNAVKRDMAELSNFGVNTIQTEIGMNTVLKRNYGLSDWTVLMVGDVDATVGLNENNRCEGVYSASVTNNSELLGGRYVNIFQKVNIKPNTYYEYGFYIKSKECKNMWFSANNWNDRKNLSNSYADWTKITYTFISGSKESERIMRFGFDGITKETYIDNVYFREIGTNDNIIKNSGFEDKSIYEFSADPTSTDSLCETLKNAEDNNISVCLLISPHYFLDYLYDKYPEIKMKNGTYITFDINHPAVISAMETYINALIPKVKDYKSLNSICITNEPAFFPNSNSVYKPKWAEFLENRYGDISTLNEKWNTNYLNFSSISMPTNFNYETQIIKDYKDFNDEIFSNWHKRFADLIHKTAPNIAVHSKTMAYIEKSESKEIRYFLSQGLDFDDFSKFSDFCGCDGWVSPWEFESIDNTERDAHEMSFMYDLMSSIKNVPVANTENHMIPDGSDEYGGSIAECTGAAIWQGFVHKCNLCCNWLWERESDGDKSFNGSIGYRPDCITEIGKSTLDANRLSYELTAVQNQPAEVGIIYSAESRVASKEFMNVCFNSYLASLYNGKKVRFITDKTPENIDKCKVIIAPRLEKLPQTIINGLIKFQNNGGKVIIVGEGCLNNIKSISNNAYKINVVMNDIYMTEPELPNLISSFEEIFDECLDTSIKVVDAKTNQSVDYVEWSHGVYNNELIINVCNYDPNNRTKNIKLLINGKEANQIYELRSETFFEKELNIEFAKPMLLKVKTDVKAPVFTTGENLITWDKQGEKSLVYKANSNGNFALVSEIFENSLKTKNGETVMVKNTNDFGCTSFGTAYTECNNPIFKTSIESEVRSESVSAKVSVENIADFPAFGVLRLEMLDENESIIQTSFGTVNLLSGEKKSISFSLYKPKDYNSVRAFVYDGLNFNKQISIEEK